tara:strand:- start:1460 stop:1807 length:348 start_codon:yes stop_codon:yes gene_type:complete
MTYGMSRQTGKKLTKRDHIGQSVDDILTTPVGTRVKRREYGSHVFDLVDSPANPTGALQIIAATAEAIERWEPRLDLQRASVSAGMDGKAVINLTGIVKDDGEAVTYGVGLGGLS